DDADEDLPAAARGIGIADRRDRGGHTAEDEADSDPDGEQENGVRDTAEAHHRQDDGGGPTDEQQNPTAGRYVQRERVEHLREARDQKVGAEEDRGDEDGLGGPDEYQNAEGE